MITQVSGGFMAFNIPCPHCEKIVNPQARLCNHGGADLALTAVEAELSVNYDPEALEDELRFL